MRIAVYAIAKNEHQNLRAFTEAVWDADLILIGDTGSTPPLRSNTTGLGSHVEIVDVNVEPFRFDDARNALLSRLPSDIDVCFSLDLDERPQEGWRKIIEQNWTPETTRMVAEWVQPQGGSAPRDRIHRRSGHRWVYPCHEALVYWGSEQEMVQHTSLKIQHLVDSKSFKVKESYLPLLEQAAKECPTDPMALFHLGREYFNRGRNKDAENFLIRATNYFGVGQEFLKSDAFRYAGRARVNSHDLDGALQFCLWAVEACPQRREAWSDYAEVLTNVHLYTEGAAAAKQALSIVERNPAWAHEGRAWGDTPQRILKRCEDMVGGIHE